MLNLEETIINTFVKNKEIVTNYIQELEEKYKSPLYSSIDIRDASFKIATIDTNLFPGGFNNIDPSHLKNNLFQKAIFNQIPECKTICIVAEEHTRNTWYLENLFILQAYLNQSQFKVLITIPDLPNTIELTTAKNNKITVQNLEKAIETHPIDLFFLNNDLTKNIPKPLQHTRIPIHPPLNKGWLTRSKSEHFYQKEILLNHLAKLINLDPWLISTKYETVKNINIFNEKNQNELYTQCENLFLEIEKKYKEHQITQSPFLFIKADAGTYGMGITVIHSPEEILSFNRKIKNKLSTGKQSQEIKHLIIQEGIPSSQTHEGHPSETCLYLINNQFLGSFHRFHSKKNQTDNLNSKGMAFVPCNIKHPILSQNNALLENKYAIYTILSQIAGYAAQKERVLEKTNV